MGDEGEGKKWLGGKKERYPGNSVISGFCGRRNLTHERADKSEE